MATAPDLYSPMTHAFPVVGEASALTEQKKKKNLQEFEWEVSEIHGAAPSDEAAAFFKQQ